MQPPSNEKVSKAFIRNTLKQEMNLKFGKVKKLPN